MATVPTVTQQQVLPNDNALPYSNPDQGYASRSAINKGLYNLGADVQKAGDYMTAALEKIQAQDDKTEFRKLDNQMSEFVRLQSYGDGTPENPGFLNLKGENAVKGYATAQQNINDYTTKLSDSASNRRVKDMFAGVAGTRVEGALGQFMNHTADERQKDMDATSTARIVAAQQDAFANPAHLERSIAVIQGEIADQAVRNGLPTEAAVQLSKAQVSDTIDKLITATTLQSTGLANKLLQQYGNQMDGLSFLIAKDKIHTQEMQNLSEAERYEAMKDKASNKAAEENANQAMGQIETLSHAQIFGLLQTHQIRRDDFNWLSSAKKAIDAGEGKSDPAALLSVDIGIRTGEITSYDTIKALADAGTISYKDAITKNATLQENLNNDPILNRDDVKQGTNYLKMTLGPVQGLEAIFDQVSKQREANALEEYQTKAKANPHQNMQALYQQVYESYRPKPIDLKELARPQFVDIGYANGSPADIKKKLVDAETATQEAVGKGDMTQAEALINMQRLEYYLTLVDQMATTTSTNINTKQ